MAKVSLAGALRIAREELERAEAKAEELRMEVRGLELAAARHQARSATATSTSPTSGDRAANLQDGARTGAVLLELLRATKPLSPSELAGLISLKRDRPERPRDIGAALSYLKRMGKVERIGQGMWVAVRPNPAPQNLETLPEDDEPDGDEWRGVREAATGDPDDDPF